MSVETNFVPSAYLAMGLIRDGINTGYRIKQAIERLGTFFWTASYGQIYPDLKKLEAAGLISGVERRSAGGRVRREYSLTDAGAAELQRWLAEPTEPAFWIRNEGLLRLMACDWEDREIVLKNLDELRTLTADRLEEMRALEPPRERGRRLKDLGDRLLEETLAWCDELEASLREGS